MGKTQTQIRMVTNLTKRRVDCFEIVDSSLHLLTSENKIKIHQNNPLLHDHTVFLARNRRTISVRIFSVV